jgi:hypothetical protein
MEIKIQQDTLTAATKLCGRIYDHQAFYFICQRKGGKIATILYCHKSRRNKERYTMQQQNKREKTK